MNTEIFDQIFKIEPCEMAVEWLKSQPDLKTAWDTCIRGDWLWWALMHIDGAMPDKEISMAFANWCAERAQIYAAYAADADVYAANAAALAAYAADAVNSAYAADAADAAAWTANAANAAAWTAERKAQADWIREHIQFPLTER